MSYDIAYQDWLRARRSKDYKLADEIRDAFEKEHGLTIFAEGAMPVIGVTVRQTRTSDWYRTHSSNHKDTQGKSVADYIDDTDSYTKTVTKGKGLTTSNIEGNK